MNEKKKMSDERTPQGAHNQHARNDPNWIISQKLKAYYASVEEEGIPDKFLDLLEKLDATERAAKGEDTADE